MPELPVVSPFRFILLARLARDDPRDMRVRGVDCAEDLREAFEEVFEDIFISV